MKNPEFDIQKVIDHLQGTCTESIETALETLYPGMEESDLSGEDHDDIANQIFNCEACGWWCEAHEQTDGGYCEDCKEAEDSEWDED